LYKHEIFGKKNIILEEKISDVLKERNLYFIAPDYVSSSYIKFGNVETCNNVDCFLSNIIIDTTIGPHITLLKGANRIGSFIYADSVMFSYGKLHSKSRKHFRLYYYDRNLDRFYSEVNKNHTLTFLWQLKCESRIIKYDNGKLYILNSNEDNKFIEFDEFLHRYSVEELKELAEYDFLYCNTF